MPDAGAQLSIDCQLDNAVTEIFSGLTPDAAGFALLNLAQQPAAKSLRVQWATARTVSNTSGGSLTTTTAMKSTDVTYTIKRVPEYSDKPDEALVPAFVSYKPDTYKPLHSD